MPMQRPGLPSCEQIPGVLVHLLYIPYFKVGPPSYKLVHNPHEPVVASKMQPSIPHSIPGAESASHPFIFPMEAAGKSWSMPVNKIFRGNDIHSYYKVEPSGYACWFLHQHPPTIVIPYINPAHQVIQINWAIVAGLQPFLAYSPIIHNKRCWIGGHQKSYYTNITMDKKTMNITMKIMDKSAINCHFQ